MNKIISTELFFFSRGGGGYSKETPKWAGMKFS